MDQPQPWFELESDPGLFTLLVEDFGIKGVQVEEIYDLDNVTDMANEAIGFIFLFRWIEERRRRRKLMNETHLSVKDKSILEKIFFAHQVIPNSCATHALLSILLNSNEKDVTLTEELTNLKQVTSGLNPEQKGDAIASIPRIASAHNSHACPHMRLQQEKQSNQIGASQTGEAYHYVSFLPINGHLYEMDGLKPWPLDHGKVSEEDWTQKFSDVITDRLGPSNGGGDIMFNLMAVVPDRRIKWKNKLSLLKDNWSLMKESISQMVNQWYKQQTNPLHEPLSTNSALNIEAWIELLKTEHNYILPDTETDTEVKQSAAEQLRGQCGSMSSQIQFALATLVELDDNETTEVIVQQLDGEAMAELGELSDFDPYKRTHIEMVSEDARSDNTYSIQELLEMLTDMKSHVTDCEQQLKEQQDLRDKYKIDVCRRTHNYYPFITAFVRMLAEQGTLTDMVNQLTQAKKKTTQQSTVTSGQKGKKRSAPNDKKKTKKKKKV